MYRIDLEINNLQWFICHKTKPCQINLLEYNAEKVNHYINFILNKRYSHFHNFLLNDYEFLKKEKERADKRAQKNTFQFSIDISTTPRRNHKNMDK